jgi:excisionase family DNA binding protein
MGSNLRVPRLLTIKEASNVTGVQRWRLYDLIARGAGPPHLRLGKTIRIAEDSLIAWIEARQHQTGTET